MGIPGITHPGQPSSQVAARSATTIAAEQACVSCGYNLQGLDASGRCPECGAPIQRIVLPTSGNTDTLGDAPGSYLTALALGAVLIALSGVAHLLDCLPPTWGMSGWTDSVNAGIVIRSIICAAWSVGVFLVVRPRPAGLPGAEVRRELDDKLREWHTLRLLALGSPVLFLISGALFSAWDFYGGNAWMIAWGCAEVLYLFSLTPVCIYLSRLSSWAPNDELAGVLRSCGVGIGAAGLVYFGVQAVPNGSVFGLLKFLLYTLLLAYPILWIYLFSQLLVFAAMVGWAKVNATSRAERDARLALKRAEAMMRVPAPVPISDAVVNGVGGELLRSDAGSTLPEPAEPSPHHQHFANERVIEPGDGKGYAIEGP